MAHSSYLCAQTPIRWVGKFSLYSEWCPHTNHPGLMEIGSDEYDYTIIDQGSPSVFRCYRLNKLTGRVTDRDGHTCTVLRDGSEDCTCGSFVFRTGLMQDGRCKHLAAIHHLLTPDNRLTDPEYPGLPEAEDPFGGVCLSETRETFDGEVDQFACSKLALWQSQFDKQESLVV
jgi:hypothetical protein